MKIETANRLNQILSGMPQDQINDLTGEKLLKLTQMEISKRIYEEFPSADPKIMEALLLLYTNISKRMLAKFGIAPQDKLFLGEIAIVEDFSIEQQEFMETFSKALRKTIKTLN